MCHWIHVYSTEEKIQNFSLWNVLNYKIIELIWNDMKVSCVCACAMHECTYTIQCLAKLKFKWQQIKYKTGIKNALIEY